MSSHETFIHPTAIVGSNVELGVGVYIGAYAVIGTPAEHHLVDVRKPVLGRVVIGAGTVIREFVTIHASIVGAGHTVIGRDCLLQAHAHIGHDAELGDGVTVACHASIGGHVNIGRFTNIGLNAVVHQHTAVPEGCMVGACAMLKGEGLQPFTTYAGVPAKAIGANYRLIRKSMSWNIGSDE